LCVLFFFLLRILGSFHQLLRARITRWAINGESCFSVIRRSGPGCVAVRTPAAAGSSSMTTPNRAFAGGVRPVAVATEPGPDSTASDRRDGRLELRLLCRQCSAGIVSDHGTFSRTGCRSCGFLEVNCRVAIGAIVIALRSREPHRAESVVAARNRDVIP
jgi:hypothetical protein